MERAVPPTPTPLCSGEAPPCNGAPIVVRAHRWTRRRHLTATIDCFIPVVRYSPNSRLSSPKLMRLCWGQFWRTLGKCVHSVSSLERPSRSRPGRHFRFKRPDLPRGRFLRPAPLTSLLLESLKRPRFPRSIRPGPTRQLPSHKLTPCRSLSLRLHRRPRGGIAPRDFQKTPASV